MGTPGDRGEEPERPGGWQSGGWQSQWQQPGSPEGWQHPQQPPPHGGAQEAGRAGWTQTPDGRWIQTGPTSSGKATAALVLGIPGSSSAR